MATYTVKDPTSGKTVTLTGDSEPTEQELEEIFASINPPTDMKSVIGNAMRNVTQKPAAFAKDLGTNPETMARAMPTLGGITGTALMPWGGATAGTAVGQGVRGAALKALGKPIPSGLQHAGELGLSAIGDVIPIPMMKKSYFGKQIGKAEKAAGVPPAQDIPSIPMATGTKTTGEFINDAVASVKSSGGRATPSYWLQIKDQIDRLYRIGKDEALTTLDKGRLKWLSAEVQKGLNNSVKGRAGPAQALAKSQAIPRTIGNAYKKLPPGFRKGAAYGTGATAAGFSAYEILKKLMGG